MSGEDMTLRVIDNAVGEVRRDLYNELGAIREEIAALVLRIDGLDGTAARLAELEAYRDDLLGLREILEERRAAAAAAAGDAETPAEEAAAEAAEEAAAEAEDTVEQAVEEVSGVIADAGEGDRAPEGAPEIAPIRSHLLTRRILGGRDRI